MLAKWFLSLDYAILLCMLDEVHGREYMFQPDNREEYESGIVSRVKNQLQAQSFALPSGSKVVT